MMEASAGELTELRVDDAVEQSADHTDGNGGKQRQNCGVFGYQTGNGGGQADDSAQRQVQIALCHEE